MNEGVSAGRKSVECCEERDGSGVQGERYFPFTPAQCGEAQKVLGAEPGLASSLSRFLLSGIPTKHREVVVGTQGKRRQSWGASMGSRTGWVVKSIVE